MDPGLTARFETAVMNEMTLRVPWEDLEPGPAGEYVAVVDEDQNGKQLYDPVDLNRPDLLAQDGLTPSDGDPHFHQQMVYAVAMRTIRTFERALGRLVHWSQLPVKGDFQKLNYERRLKLYPHYLREPIAYYNLVDRALCFGYFVSAPNTPLPETHVFTCLSQDVIALELTHALLEGLGVLVNSYGTNPEVIAFHEALADLIALFLHFWKSDVLRAQIADIRGRLEERSLLGAVAFQFGQALGKPDGLRNALGRTDDQGNWQPRRPDPKLYQTTTQPHDRGDILVGAVFEAFRKIYESRVANLRRIASRGTGELPAGNLHPDLVNRFTREAARAADLVLDMCIRALDYLPPVGASFGDFLRAAITADHDLNPADPRHYRVAFIQAFRSYGISPHDVGTLSAHTLLWPGPENRDQTEALESFVSKLSRKHANWNLPRDRAELWCLLEEKKLELKKCLSDPKAPKRLGAIDLKKPFEVQSLHPRQRTGAAGDLSSQWVIKLVQPPSTPRSRVGNVRRGVHSWWTRTPAWSGTRSTSRCLPARRARSLPRLLLTCCRLGRRCPPLRRTSGDSGCSPSTRPWASPWRPRGSTRSPCRSHGNETGPAATCSAPARSASTWRWWIATRPARPTTPRWT